VAASYIIGEDADRDWSQYNKYVVKLFAPYKFHPSYRAINWKQTTLAGDVGLDRLSGRGTGALSDNAGERSLQLKHVAREFNLEVSKHVSKWS